MNTPPVILITGASSGIGAASARVFGQGGYRVVLAARREDRLALLAEEIEHKGGQVLAVPTDIGQRNQIENLVSRTLETYGQIDVLFNNAGFGRLAWLEDLNPQDDIDRQVQVNLLGLIHTSRTVLPHMIQRQRGHIINMASIAGLIAPPTYSIYAASKFGVAGFTQALRREVALYGIRVSGIYPGGVATEFEQHVGRPSQVQVATPGWLLLSAEQVAQEVWRIAQRPHRMVVIPRVMWLAVWLNAIAPGLVDAGIRILFTQRMRGV
jgi:short-subunit dehydrogenase